MWMLMATFLLCPSGLGYDVGDPPNVGQLVHNVVCGDASFGDQVSEQKHMDDITIQRSNVLATPILTAELRKFDLTLPVGDSGFNGEFPEVATVIKAAIYERDGQRNSTSDQSTKQGTQRGDDLRPTQIWHLVLPALAALIGYVVGAVVTAYVVCRLLTSALTRGRSELARPSGAAHVRRSCRFLHG